MLAEYNGKLRVTGTLKNYFCRIQSFSHSVENI